ncbi:unnamed protein product [Ilex paraguariensis]|uniref:Uncharacterized protein n=1 Tax=Ilex paraguariensis TaxID=185542 RepID=A0ABC8R444_9AQUA
MAEKRINGSICPARNCAKLGVGKNLREVTMYRSIALHSVVAKVNTGMDDKTGQHSFDDEIQTEFKDATQTK